jgi:hypothetical protein
MSDDAWKSPSDRDPEEVSLEQQIKELIRTEPFHPFVIIMSSGHRYEVTDAFSVSFGRSVINVFPKSGAGIYLRKNQIVAVESPESVQ